MKKNTVLAKIAKVGGVLSTYFTVASASFAQSAAQYIGNVTTAGSGNLIEFIRSALNLVIALSALVAVGVLVYSGVLYIIAAGEEGKIEKATKGIQYAVIGLVICFISVLIVNFVLQQLLKVN